MELDKTSFVTEVNSVKQICQPLQSLGINDFFFMRVYKDHTIIDLATHIGWGQLFFSNVFNTNYGKIEIHNHFYPSHYLNLWEDHPDNTIWQEGKNFFNVGNGITLVHKTEKYTEIFSFFTDKDNFKPNDFYLVHIEILEKFIFYFKERAKILILNSERNKILIPPHYQLQEKFTLYSSTDAIAAFLNLIQDKKHFTKTKQFSTLTKRECECLYWLANGKTAEETGTILDCSKRTIEFHIDNIKQKTNTTKITSLIYQATSLGLI